jgi:chromate transporter
MEASIDRSPTLRALAAVFARYGNSTFGGGTATIVEIERHIIDERAWLSRDESHLAFAICRLTPGTNLLAYCVGVGWRMRGLLGAIVALTTASLPCAAIAVALTHFFSTWTAHRLTTGALRAALAAAIGIMVGTARLMVRPYVARREYARTAAFATTALFLALSGTLTPFRVLAAAAVLGALFTGSGTDR